MYNKSLDTASIESMRKALAEVEVNESDRAKHYKGATPPEDMKNKKKAGLGYVVLEVKYPIGKDDDYREYLHMKILSQLPLRLNKSSKYIEGLSGLKIL